MLTLTGSNRDKLDQLVIKKDQPSFGSHITTFPLLGQDYIDFFTNKVNTSLASNNQFCEKSVWKAFQLAGHRPEILRQLIGQVAINDKARALSRLLEQDANTWQNQIWEEFSQDFSSISPLSQTILIQLAKEDQLSPFSEQSMQLYREAVNQPSLSVSSVQAAINSLRERGFI